MSEKGTDRNEARVQRRRASEAPDEAQAAPMDAPDLGDLLTSAPGGAEPEPLKKGQVVHGKVSRVAADAIFLDLGDGRTGVLPLEAHLGPDGTVRLVVGQPMTGIVRVTPGASATVLLSKGPRLDAAEAAPEPEADPEPEAAPEPDDAPEPIVAKPAPKPAAPKPAPRPVVVASEPEEEEDFAALLADHLDEAVRITEGAEVSGPVVKVTDEYLFVNLGAKTEGVLDTAEYKDEDGNVTLKVGDRVTAYVISTGMDEGGIRLSRSVGVGPNPIEALQEAFEVGLPVEARIVSRNKGGFEVKVGAVRGFLPLSQLDVHRVEEDALDDYIGQTLRFKISRIKGKEVVVSRADLLKEEAAETIARLKEELGPGVTVTGRVRSIKDYGAFVELAPGLDGLLHVSEMSWGRVTNPSEVLEVGQEVTVHVLKYDKDSGRLSLGLKQLGKDPWETVLADFSEGQTITGPVVRLTKFGAFINLADGIDGLLHISNMSWGKRINKPEEVVKVGDQVEVQILNIDPDTRRIGLGLKQLKGDPWAGVDERFPVGAQIEGKVEKVETFGIFVNLEPGVTALLPMSESGMDRGADPKRAFSVGSVVKAAVLEVDADRRRMTLSLKVLDGAEERESFKAYQTERAKAPRAEAPAGFGTLAAKFAALKQK